MTRRRWIVFHAMVIFLIAYVASYFYISRLRIEQYKQGRFPGFLYVAPASVSDDPDSNWRVKNGLLNLFYTPINKLDQAVLGTPSPDGCIMTGIGPRKK